MLAGVLYSASTAFHEISHLLFCKVLHCKIVGWKIFFFCYNDQKLYFNKRGKNYCSFISSSRKKRIAIAAVGPITELVVSIFCLQLSCYSAQAWIKDGLIGAFCLIFLSSVLDLLPITGSDGKMIFGKDEQ